MEIQRLNKELEIYKKFADEERESEKKKEWTQKISENITLLRKFDDKR